MTRLLKPLAAAAALISSHAPLAQGAPVSQMHAYEGPRRPAAQLATVYGAIRLNRLDRTMICEVDGKSVRTFSGCRSIVYLLPGSHRLQISYSFGAIRKANGTLTASFAAGRVYHIESGPAGNWVSFRLREKPPGSALTYKDVYPDNPLLSVTVQGSRIDPAAEKRRRSRRICAHHRASWAARKPILLDGARSVLRGRVVLWTARFL